MAGKIVITKKGYGGRIEITPREYAKPVPYRSNGSSGGSGQKGYLVKGKTVKSKYNA